MLDAGSWKLDAACCVQIPRAQPHPRPYAKHSASHSIWLHLSSTWRVTSHSPHMRRPLPARQQVPLHNGVYNNYAAVLFLASSFFPLFLFFDCGHSQFCSHCPSAQPLCLAEERNVHPASQPANQPSLHTIPPSIHHSAYTLGKHISLLAILLLLLSRPLGTLEKIIFERLKPAKTALEIPKCKVVEETVYIIIGRALVSLKKLYSLF